MAISGLGLVGFVLFHMLGNLQLFKGRDAYNDYAAFMQGWRGMLWVARAGLLAFLVVHVGSAVKLTRRNRAARTLAYRTLRHRSSSRSGRLMLQSGLVVLLFVIYHLAHFTFGLVHAEGFELQDAYGRPDVFDNVVLSFQNPWIAGSYVVANLALASHLAHAVTSTFKTLGVAVGRAKRGFELVGPAVGLVVATGNISMPIACLVGLISPELR